MEADERPSKKRRVSHDDPTAMRDGFLQAPPENEQAVADITPAEGQDQVTGDDKSIGFPGADGTTDDGLPTPVSSAPLAATISDAPNGQQPMSKNQQKKLRRQQQWEAKKPERKLLRKQKIAAKRERKREEREQNGGLEPANLSAAKSIKEKAMQLPITFLIDCDFDNLMLHNERISLAGQVTRSYSDNRRARFRAHLAICSFGGHLRERFENVLGHYKQWKGVRFVEDDFVEAAAKARGWMAGEGDDADGRRSGFGGAFAALAPLATTTTIGGYEETMMRLKEQSEIVYLTSEGEETLTELKPFSTYIIGGLVDKNREKGICYKRATARGVRTAKLPIGEFLEMSSRKVLATNHVNEIMLKWLECGDWGEAFLQVIPKRKGGKLKEGEGKDRGGTCDTDDAEGGEESAGDRDASDDEDKEPFPFDGGDGTEKVAIIPEI